MMARKMIIAVLMGSALVLAMFGYWPICALLLAVALAVAL